MSKDDSLNVLQEGWHTLADHMASPNFDARPLGCVPDLLVIHAISLPLGQFSNSYPEDLFLNRLDLSAHSDFEQLRGVHVSAHFLIRRDGRLVQFVGVGQRAWHAGTSHFMGRENCNDFSIGIELQGSDFVPFEAAQYQTLAKLSDALIQHYPIQHIAGHQDIAPGRKTDPGSFFDWALYRRQLDQLFHQHQLDQPFSGLPNTRKITFRVEHK